MILPEFEYRIPKTLQEACMLAREHAADGKVMAGGTDVIIAIKEKVICPSYIIDLKGIPGLDYLEYDEKKGLRIGALTKLRTIAQSALVKERMPAVAEAAHCVASTQVRAKGTMAGNVVNASPSADTVPILLALDAVLSVSGVEGERKIPIREFYTGLKKTALQAGELVTEIRIPPLKENQKMAYIKHATRKAMDLAIVGVAAVITVEKGICTDASICLGAVDITAIQAPGAEKALIGKTLDEQTLTAAAAAAMQECAPISDVRASAEYRRDMVRVFTKRAIKKALEQ